MRLNSGHTIKICLVFLSALTMFSASPVQAALGRATADFDNQKPNKSETAWGRFVADSLKGAAGSDLALINAGALRSGTLRAGAIEQEAVDALLNFGDDDIVTLTLTGAQLREALERAVREYPTADVAFLHGSGLSVSFNGRGGPPRIVSLRVGGREIAAGDSLRVAMPVSLANDAYFNVWNSAQRQSARVKVRQAVANYTTQRKTISPDGAARIAPR
jgi:hypothetical protein